MCTVMQAAVPKFVFAAPLQKLWVVAGYHRHLKYVYAG